MPIVGSFAGASARAYGLGAGALAILPGAYESISTTVVGAGNATDITFSSIPQTYTHLQLRMSVRCSATNGGSVRVRFNSDSGLNYTYHVVGGDGASAGVASGANTTEMIAGSGLQNTTYFAGQIIDILDYRDTNKFKTMRHLGGVDANGSGAAQLASGLWRSTSAVTSIYLVPQSASFSQYSHFALYGVNA
jgi:hypothetical protein